MTSNKILFFSEEIEYSLPHSNQVIKWLTETVAYEQATLAAVNYIFCSDEYLLKINQEHLNHDYYTDVISFPYGTDPIEGDIFISIDRVTDNAKTNGVNTEHELHRVMLHGLLHFLGYLDKSPEEKEKMTQKENFYLNQLNL